MNFESKCIDKTNTDEIFEDKYSCFNEDINENVSAQTLSITNQFNNSLKLNKGKIKKEDFAVFIDEEFLNKRGKICEKVIDTEAFECKIRKDIVLKNSFTVTKSKSNYDESVAQEKM